MHRQMSDSAWQTASLEHFCGLHMQHKHAEQTDPTKEIQSQSKVTTTVVTFNVVGHKSGKFSFVQWKSTNKHLNK